MAKEILRPNAPGDECNLDQQRPSDVVCPNHYQLVDEIEADNFTSYVSVSDIYFPAYASDLYNIEDSNVQRGTINSIAVYAVVYCYTITGAEECLKIAIKPGIGAAAPTMVTESGEILVEPTASSAPWPIKSNQWSTNPATGVAWTWDEINNLQAGVSLKRPYLGISPQCTQVYVEVNYDVPSVGIDLSEMMNLMITVMIVGMMMKMMTGMMAK